MEVTNFLKMKAFELNGEETVLVLRDWPGMEGL